mmetsp:Transcript_13701/g.29262  ORF Transcript_13701/g.29262 Transcript_13701/m.29262 type:complete len:287 (-) Transcript_13701:154-1014(-)
MDALRAVGLTMNGGDTLKSIAHSTRSRDMRVASQLNIAKQMRLSRRRTCSVVARAEDGAPVHKVKPGDTLYGVTKKYPGTDITELMKINSIADGSFLAEGQVLRLPTDIRKKLLSSTKEADKKVYATTQPEKLAPPRPAGAESVIPCWLCTVQSAVAGLLVIWSIWRVRKLAVKAAKEKEETQRRNETSLRRRQQYWNSILSSDRGGEDVGFERPENLEEDKEDYDVDSRRSRGFSNLRDAFMMWWFWSKTKTSSIADESIAKGPVRGDQAPPKEEEPEIIEDYVI